MKDLIDALKEMDTSTLLILGFAAVLLIFLLVLIIVTIKILRTNYEIEEDEEKTGKPVLLDDDEEDEEEEEDETSKMIREAVESVEGTKAKMEAEKIEREAAEAAKAADKEARKTAAERAQAIADAVHGEAAKDGEATDTEDAYSEEDYDDSSDDDYSEQGDAADPDGATGELDTTKIRNALKKARAEAMESGEDYSTTAKQRAEAPEYNASFDSAFVDRPAYEEKIDPVIPNPTPESILGPEGVAAAGTENAAYVSPVQSGSGVEAGAPVQETPVIKGPDLSGMNISQHSEGKITVNPVNVVPEPTEEELTEVKEFLEENPKPEKKKRKLKKKDKVFEEKFGSTDGEIKVAQYFWYNKQDVEGLPRKEDMYFKCHYFNSPDAVIPEIVTEMYDCGFVRTEELQRIAYGITFKSLGMKEILKSEENLGFNKENAVKEPSESDKAEAYEKWCHYVDSFKEIIVINAPKEVQDYIMQQLYDYGHKDIEELMYSPY